MVVGGFELPEAFVQLCEAIQRGEAPKEWELKENVDAYGRPWKVADLLFECDPNEMQYWTERIRHDYLHENRFHDRGLIEDFTGVANFVRFAHATDGDFYMFDFGKDPKEPSVVYFEGGYWRRAAPDFQTFMTLFVPVELDAVLDRLFGDEDELLPGDEGREAVQPTARIFLAARTGQWVVAKYPPSFEEIASYYAACSAEERREVEAEVRESLKEMEVTDDQWRAHEELWARLHATDRSN
jgi:hypothetical protein